MKINQLHVDDADREIYAWVHGACYVYAARANLRFSNQIAMDLWVDDCQIKIFKHLMFGKRVDASYSDFQCDLALRAKKIFGSFYSQHKV